MACSAISVSWSAMARLSLAVCARFALTCSETMIDSCGRLRIVSSSGHGVLSKPTTLPANSQTTMPVVMPMNTHIEPQNLFTTSAILSRMLVPRTWSDTTSFGLCCSGALRISSARRCTAASAWSISRTAAPSVFGLRRAGEPLAAAGGTAGAGEATGWTWDPPLGAGQTPGRGPARAVFCGYGGLNLAPRP